MCCPYQGKCSDLQSRQVARALVLDALFAARLAVQIQSVCEDADRFAGHEFVDCIGHDGLLWWFEVIVTYFGFIYLNYDMLGCMMLFVCKADTFLFYSCYTFLGDSAVFSHLFRKRIHGSETFRALLRVL